MLKNTVGDFIKSVFSTLVNKDDEVFKSLFANQNETGVIEGIFNNLEKCRDIWCNNSNVYNQSGEMLEKSISFFSVLTRLFDESDDSLKRRNEMVFYRNGATLWGNVMNTRIVFQQYFKTAHVYIVNNTNAIEENLLRDGDFEIQNNSWTLEKCNYNTNASFSGRTCLKFDGLGTCDQDVAVDKNSTYFLHFFLAGKIKVKITDNNGRYWDRHDGEFGTWARTEKTTEFDAKTWDAKSIYFLTDEIVSYVAITFVGIHSETALIDYARLFSKGNYSSFTLIAALGGIHTEESFSMAPGANDPIDGVDYSKMSYIEQSPIYGTGGTQNIGVYKDLLEIVQPAGIISYFEILNKEFD